MASELDTSSLGDALVILGAAGIVIPTFARFKINPVIGFILVGIIAGPFGLGHFATNHDVAWLQHVTIQDPEAIAPFADFGVVLLLFAIGLELSIGRLVAMRRMVFGIGAAEMLGTAAIIGGLLIAFDWPTKSAAALGLALAMSSTAIVLPISGTKSAVGRAALAMLLFEDVALVPMLFFFGTVGGADVEGLTRVAVTGVLLIGAMMLLGRIVLPPLFAQAARTKSPEVFLAISLLTVILAASATSAVGLSPILGALVAGLLIAETEYHSEVEVMTAPFRGLGLGVFLITIGMQIDLGALWGDWHLLLGALAGVLLVKAIVTGLLLRIAGARRGVAAETGVLMASPSETTLIVLGAAGAAGVLARDTVAFWSAVTAIGLSVTPFLASLGRHAARRVEREAMTENPDESAAGRTVIFGFGRVGRMVADMLVEHDRPYLAIDSDIDSASRARKAGYSVLYGDVARGELTERLDLDKAAALVMTMDDPVLTARLTRKLRTQYPGLPIIARARDSEHAGRLYKAGVTDAVPEALEASLQLSEAVLVDIGVAMGPVIASIHEKRSELRARIMEEGELAVEPSLGRRRLGDEA
ncbi:cation:proton antiporter [Sphingomicrobium nitratireducens]|uniref:cation:proton antiporter domain-containing protein n=1 Tax=Sphingomicrobium nitratireducens TaxID=2964666 RepID=UPI0022400356|nr:cation:proton antiporter [Sphingomicrobium nitratireducens]